MHNYGETGQTAVQGRLINGRFTGNLQHRYGCSLKTGQIHLARPSTPDGDFNSG